MMHNKYKDLLVTLPTTVAEKKSPYNYLTERHIQAIWMEQKHLQPLRTYCGRPIKILSPGIWKVEAGPDFRKAHIKIDGKELFGDIEIHLDDLAWKQHGHHQDPRYDNVILHVSFWHSYGRQGIVTSAGKEPFLVHLEKCMTITPARLLQLIDLDLYPYKRFIGSGKCAQKLFHKLPNDQMESLFYQAAHWRLAHKAAIFKRITNTHDHFSAGVALALGYKNNSETFLELFLEMQKLKPDNEMETLAWLMAKTGFFKKYFITKWGSSELYQQLHGIALQQRFPIDSPINLELNQIRPLNHPIRRFVYMAKLHSHQFYSDTVSQAKLLWQAYWKQGLNSKKWKCLVDQLLSLIPTYTDDYWNYHYLFEVEPSKKRLSLLGGDLKANILINTLLPLLHDALKTSDATDLEWKAFQAFYQSLPSLKTGKAKYLRHRFFGDASKGDVLKKGYTEQGAYQLHYDFCVHYESSCEGCPFVDRYQQVFATSP